MREAARPMRLLKAGALLLLLGGCVLSEEDLPKVHVRNTPVPCSMPVPPPTLVLTVGSDPSHCVPTRALERGFDVLVHVSPDGWATAVEDSQDLCLVVGRDGKVIPPHLLVPSEKECILESLRDWRFAGATTCWPAYAYVSLGPACCQTGLGEK
jgi:hypothetical protein